MSTPCILHVEDEQDDVFLLKAAFKQAGIRGLVQVAQDGQEAIDYLSGTGVFADRERYPLPCLILLDLKLPRLSGFEVLEWLNAQPRLRRIRVVVLTSSGRAADVERAYQLGASSFAVKPEDFHQLAKMVQLLQGWWFGCNQFAPF